MFGSLLIANRGEIACRIMKTARRMGLRTVAVYSDADAGARHVRLADEAVRIGPAAARESYLVVDHIIDAAKRSGAEAIHPGYGFLSENPLLAEACAANGVVFVGPTPEAIRAMGSKSSAKAIMEKAGVRTTPGYHGAEQSPAGLAAQAERIGYPVLIKAASGGGGRGMKVAVDEAALAPMLAQAKTESAAAFGDDTVYIEKYLGKPRHIEFQIFGDGRGRAVHLGERDCSLQRRHQKVFEESPSPAIDAATRDRMGRRCADAMAALGYAGAGTIEFLYEDGEFYFIEMNTRIQVEHPVTEMVTGVDLVAEQIRVAGGLPMSLEQDKLGLRGHAIEVRINAEDPRTFAPSPGTIRTVHPAGGPGVRVDSAVYAGYRVPPYYDSLIAKLIVHGPDRAACLRRLRRALQEYVIEGVKTTLPLHQALLEEADIQNGDYSIKWLEAWLQDQRD